jgi:hypothetical protein
MNAVFLTILLGIAISILGREIITYKNAKVLRKIQNTKNYEHYAPFILSFIAVFALIEYCRVTNTIVIKDTANKDSIEAWSLYIDLLFFLFAFISMGGYSYSVSLFKQDKDGNVLNFSDEEELAFSKALARSTSFLGIFLFIGFGRYMLTISYVEDFLIVGRQAIAHIAGIILCMIAYTAFRKKNINVGFYCSSIGLVVVVAYFVLNNIL